MRSLSSIASEFSTFAKMRIPTVLNASTCLICLTRRLPSLNIWTFHRDYNRDDKPMSMPTATSCCVCFNNLLKNAIGNASLPTGRVWWLIDYIITEHNILLTLKTAGRRSWAARENIWSPTLLPKLEFSSLGLAFVKKTLSKYGGRFGSKDQDRCWYYVLLWKHRLQNNSQATLTLNL